MDELLHLIRSNPWPFAAGLILVVVAILAENFGKGDKSQGGDPDLPDFDWGGGD